jgi:flagellar motor switch protein FliG
MEIAVKKLTNGNFALEIDAVMIELEPAVVKSLHEVIDRHLSQSTQMSDEATQKKLQVFKALANKMVEADDRVLQQFLPKLKPAQLVTLVRLSDGQKLYDKVTKNLSRTNVRQFEEDYQAMDKITVHQAIINMEQIIPLLKEAIAQQKRIDAGG